MRKTYFSPLKCPNFLNCHRKAIHETPKNKFLELKDLAFRVQPSLSDCVLHACDKVCRNCYEKLVEVEAQGVSKKSDCDLCTSWVPSFNSALENCESTSDKIRLLSAAPINELSQNEIVAMFPKISHYMLKQAKSLVKEKGKYSKPDMYPGHPIDEDVLETAQEYYLNAYLDCTSQSPNKNDTRIVYDNGVKVKKVKRFMTRSIKETYKLFCEDHPDMRMGHSKVYSLRPK